MDDALRRALIGGHTPPPATGTAASRVGVAWWGDYVETGPCHCCGQTRRLRKGYNGGAHMSARFCGPCTADGHDGNHEGEGCVAVGPTRSPD